jgi:hypothetical protein
MRDGRVKLPGTPLGNAKRSNQWAPEYQTAGGCRRIQELLPCLVGKEARLSAHFVSRTLRHLGHEPWIMVIDCQRF